MKKSGKNVEKARNLVEARPYKLGEAAELLKETHHTKFNETVELAINLEVAKAIKEVKAGKVEFRVDKAGIVHCPIGKIQFDGAKLAENAHAVIEAVVKAKPAAAKGKYVKKITLTSTMGPGITIDLT